MQFEDKTYTNPQGWNFGVQYRIIMIIIATAALVFDLATLRFSIMDIVIITLAIPVIFTSSEMVLDFENKRYREARYLFGVFVYGNWAPFPDFEYVSIFNAQINNTFNSRGSQASVTVTELQVNLVYNKNRRITACTMPDKEKALVAQKYFAHKLGGLRRLDATVRPFEWLDE